MRRYCGINPTLESNEVDLKELRAKREAYGNTARNILARAEAEGRALTDEEARDFDGLKAKIAALSQTLDRAAQLGELRAQIEKPIVSGPIVPANGEGMVYVPRDLRPGEVRVLKPNEAFSESRYQGPGVGALVRGLSTGRWDGAEELRAMAEGTGGVGGYLVPTPLSGFVIDLMRNQAQVMRAGAMTVPMATATLKMARWASDPTAAWTAENAAITASDGSVECVTFTAQKLAALVKMSIEVVMDANNIDQLVMNALTKALALEVDRVALYGSGVAPEPKGIKAATGVTLTDLGANGYTLIDYSKFSAGITTLAGYNFPGPFGILYSARTAGELDNLQDTLHQPLRQPDLVAAARKFVTNQVPTNITHGSSNTTSDAFIGQWDNCMIGIRTDLILEILREATDATSSAAVNAQIWIRALLRADVQLAHPKAFNVLEGIL